MGPDERTDELDLACCGPCFSDLSVTAVVGTSAASDI